MAKISFEEFAKEVATAVQAALAVKGKSVTVKVEPFSKNGVSVIGIVIKKDEENVAPCFNCTLEQYEKVTSGELSFGKYINDLVSSYQNAEREASKYADVERCLTPEFVFTNVFLSFVDRERNKEMLETAVHCPFNDTNLELVARIRVNEEASFVVKKDMLDVIGVSEADLLFSARLNTITSATCIPMSNFFDMPEDVPMFAITNVDMCQGAASIINEYYLKELFETFGTFFILPSSVHECIVIPNVADSNVPLDSLAEDLLALVCEVNQTEVLPQERLADSVYIFDGDAVRQLK